MNIESFLKKKIKKPRKLKIIRYEFSHTSFDHHFTYSSMCYYLLKFRPVYETPISKWKRLLVTVRLTDLVKFNEVCYYFGDDTMWKQYFRRFKKDLFVDNISDLKKVVKKVIKTYIEENPDDPELKTRNDPNSFNYRTRLTNENHKESQ